MQANEFLEQAVGETDDRAKTYDSPSGERSMAKTVAMFNALTDSQITEEQGWKFMACLKLVRSEQGAFRADNFVDGAAYFALAGETASSACARCGSTLSTRSDPLLTSKRVCTACISNDLDNTRVETAENKPEPVWPTCGMCGAETLALSPRGLCARCTDSGVLKIDV